MKTTVKIDNEYRVEIDEYNHALIKHDKGGYKVVFAGKETIKKPSDEVIGYYPDMAQALRKVAFLKSLEDGDCDLSEYIDRLEKLAA